MCSSKRVAQLQILKDLHFRYTFALNRYGLRLLPGVPRQTCRIAVHA